MIYEVSNPFVSEDVPEEEEEEGEIPEVPKEGEVPEEGEGEGEEF